MIEGEHGNVLFNLIYLLENPFKYWADNFPRDVPLTYCNIILWR